MQQLKDLIEQSRHWASVERGTILFSQVALLLHDDFGLDAGMMIYRKKFIPEEEDPHVKVYSPWGIDYTAEELTQFISNGKWFSGSSYNISQRWFHVSEGPPVWRKVWEEAGVEYVSAWPLTVKEEPVGAIVLGMCRMPSSEETDLVSACSTYVSLVLEMLTLRRIAEHASRHDSLTEILNRRGFTEKFKQLVNRNVANLVVGVLDVDYFKKINDTHGHIAGDSVLQDVAQLLKTSVGSQGICARFGGDEFVFALETEPLDTREVTNKVIEWFKDKAYTVSVGCAKLGIDGRDWDSCFRCADKRLYESKIPSITD
ncbi:GGDEF domain-containing protein [Alicyclobacillus sp. SO9]|uniref:GGDEF domain-containing protein n=1 Tax=Alicyclobacillus sp. SO9 TaxID=2665646 RepID=UPI0018E82EFF|nr:GGDEF domain-containing protein [Alicyclobacillus sp. SO9]QQE79710.1 GGDEF domain-containing protein [Alicyclobacillus sp. SO9]